MNPFVQYDKLKACSTKCPNVSTVRDFFFLEKKKKRKEEKRDSILGWLDGWTHQKLIGHITALLAALLPAL